MLRTLRISQEHIELQLEHLSEERESWIEVAQIIQISPEGSVRSSRMCWEGRTVRIN